MLKILTIVGARPQFIKAAAISRAVENHYRDAVQEILVHTGQHYDHYMSEVFFREMGIPEPAYNLGIGSDNHGSQTGKMLMRLEELMLREKPDGIIVYGDTNSTMAAALAASKIFIPVIHIEAGLRSANKKMPEEINRIATDHVSTLMFSPTMAGIRNLQREGFDLDASPPFHIDNPGIFHSGDVMFDNTIFFQKRAEEVSEILSQLKLKRDNFILATIHRPVNTDSEQSLGSILKALLDVSESLDTDVILPLHPRTSRKIKSFRDQSLITRLIPGNGVHLIPAVSYLDMIRLESQARVILTDSGGVQKEAWFLKKPVVILRGETEWTEIVEYGNGVLAGTSSDQILHCVEKYLENPPVDFPPIFGSGKAAEEIMHTVTSVKWG